MKYPIITAVGILILSAGWLVPGLSLDKNNESQPKLMKPLRLEEAHARINNLSGNPVTIIGYLGTASNQHEHFILAEPHNGIVFDHSVLNIQLKSGDSIIKLNEMADSGLNNIFINELIRVNGIISQNEETDTIYLNETKISFPLLEEKMRIAEIFGFVSKQSAK